MQEIRQIIKSCLGWSIGLAALLLGGCAGTVPVDGFSFDRNTWTRDEWEVQFSDVFDQINAFAAGTPKNVVNPDVSAASR